MHLDVMLRACFLPSLHLKKKTLNAAHLSVNSKIFLF